MCSFTKYYNRVVAQREVSMNAAYSQECGADWDVYSAFVRQAEKWDAISQRIYFRFHGNYRDNGPFCHDFIIDHEEASAPF